MRIAQVLIGSLVLFQSVSLYAESAKQCLKYWNEPVVQFELLEDTQCPHVWEDNFNPHGKKVVEKIGFNLKNNNWMSAGICNHIKYKKNNYYIYWADMKHNKTDIIMIFNDNAAFLYSREIDRTKIKESGYTRKDILDVNLSCAQSGSDLNMVSVINSYILKETNIKDISKYQIFDRFK
ncbi:hypothetical protein [Acinetobacter haemolyticus]|uniref:hypothetical protein n=1 Tax=Acinetobacter haemolyticus TaxID=29430 RepID=UPI000DEAD039|nr:hypothetical protein [Acinetobacter haemolyticus]WHR56981.1 hypothetical protein PGW89_11090 [Acinetobacter haemolyticus]